MQTTKRQTGVEQLKAALARVSRDPLATKPVAYRRIKTIRSHAGLGRFMAECSEEPVAEVPRISNIRSPYAFGPTHPAWDWKGRKVIVVETAHRQYEVFEVEV